MELLSKSPLVEAVCEILFMPTAIYDSTLPGVLYAELKSEYPIKKDKPSLIPAPNLVDEKLTDFITIPVSQFFSNDNTQAVQIGKDILTNNMMAPYKGWDSFKSQILKVLDIYCSNFINMPQIRRITLKYVNVMVFNLNDDYNKIFSFKLPNPPEDKYSKNRAFNTLVEYDKESGDILSLSFKSVFPPDNSKKSVNLELSYHHLNPNRIEIENIEQWLNVAHVSIEDLFKASFTKTFFHKLK